MMFNFSLLSLVHFIKSFLWLIMIYMKTILCFKFSWYHLAQDPVVLFIFLSHHCIWIQKSSKKVHNFIYQFDLWRFVWVLDLISTDDVFQFFIQEFWVSQEFAKNLMVDLLWYAKSTCFFLFFFVQRATYPFDLL